MITQEKIIETKTEVDVYKYLVSYKSSIHMTNGVMSIPLYVDDITSDILTTEQNFAVTTSLIEKFTKFITNKIEEKIKEDITDDFTPDVEILILSITKMEG